ncbi:sensor histidine kinase [Sphaerisporangium aureirubrum]|uniref:histidine kinase n=1 Tax=Sphaerisporangium aureirubrum TaxID=1544736 RepID=A0ABW1NM01_9ACTN
MSSPRPIRTKLLRILVLPLVSMVALWGVIAYSGVQEIGEISRTQSRWQAIGAPVLQLVYYLQRERQATVQVPVYAISGDPVLADQRRVTDEQINRLRQLIVSPPPNQDPGTAGDLRTLVGTLDTLQSIRHSADGGRLLPPLRIIQSYNKLIDDAYRQLSDGDTLSEVSTYRALRGMAAYIAGAEYLSRENALLTSAMVRQRMAPADRAAFVAATSSRRLVMADAGRDMRPALGIHYENMVRSLPYKRVQAVEDKLFNWGTNEAPPVEPGLWKSDADLLLQSIVRDTQYELFWSEEGRQASKVSAYWRIGLILGIGLLAIFASIVLSYRFGFSLIRELRRLQKSAVELAGRRLPRLVERLRTGEDVDPATEAPELESAGTAEVERVVEAFSAVQRTAIEATVDQARLRKGVSQVFLNLAWRNQALLHRQLTLLDTMERRVEEPDILEDLFRLDHLTTRMRRHAENLVILSEATPARRWRDPVSIFDVVRSAVLEVEDYTRVVVPPMQQAPPLLGVAVADVIHLVAELVENAAVFSPPDTSVQVRGMKAANGFALEVEDRGLGLSQTVLDDLNAKLADPPEFDLVDTDRLGLFVVARLAARHGIKVSLRRSPYEGTTAIVLLPISLLATPAGDAAQPGLTDTAGWDPTAVAEAPASAARQMRALTTASHAAPRALSSPGDDPEPPGWNGTYGGQNGPGGNGPGGGQSGPGGNGPVGAHSSPSGNGPLTGQTAGGNGPLTGQTAPGGNRLIGGHSGSGGNGPVGTHSGQAGNGPIGAHGAPGGHGPLGAHSGYGGNRAPVGPDRRGPVLEPPSDWFVAGPRPAPEAYAAPRTRPAPPSAAPAAPQGSPRPAGALTPNAAYMPSTEEDDLDGLPMRVRQANLAPQLRHAQAAEQREVTVRSPEELLNIMSSMQRGWRQGRGEAGQK